MKTDWVGAAQKASDASRRMVELESLPQEESSYRHERDFRTFAMLMIDSWGSDFPFNFRVIDIDSGSHRAICYDFNSAPHTENCVYLAAPHRHIRRAKPIPET